MAFAHGREPLETTDEKLVEAVERTDAGVRLALPELMSLMAERRRPEPDCEEQPLDHELAHKLMSRLLEGHTAIFEGAKGLPLEGQEDLHQEISSILDQITLLGREVVGRWES